MRKTRQTCLLLAMVLLGVMPMKGQKQIFMGFNIETGNEWSDLIFQIPFLIEAAIQEGQVGLPMPTAPFRFNSFKQNGQEWDYEGHNVFGFKAVDLFRDFEITGKVGWQPVRSPVGIYARFGYSHENFETRASKEEGWLKHRINFIRPGLGIRLSPFENLIGSKGFCPILEIGSTYDYHFSYSNGIDTDADALNNGISFNIAAGIKFTNGYSLMLTFDRQNYDLFNTDFKRNGTKPFEGVTTNHSRLMLNGYFAF